MTPIVRYLAEEIALDHADGLLTRREALRRLGLLGIGAAAAASLLAACGGGPRVGSSRRETVEVTPSASPVTATPITFASPAGRTVRGAWAAGAKATAAVLVVHENRGLTDHIRSVAGRIAAAGYGALAVDLLSPEGGTEAFADPAEATAAIGRAPPERFVEDMKAALTEAGRRVGDGKLAAIGFCFGGGMVWRLLASGEARLAAAVPFYGPLPEPVDFSGSKQAAVLAVYAELDARVNASREAAKAALERDGLVHEVLTFPGADHAFFNDTGPRYQPTAAAQAWTRTLDWFHRHLA